MEEKTIKIGSDQLHMIKTDRFKTITIRLVLKEEIKKENITKRNFLASMLTDTSEKYPTKRLLIRKAEELYNVDFQATNSRMGNFSTTNLTMTLLNEKYTEKGMLEESIAFLGEMLFHPNIKDKAFDSKSFDFILENSRKEILGMEERKESLAIDRLLENMGTFPYSYRNYGYLDDLEKITRTNLVDFYHDWLKRVQFDIYVLGDISFSDIEKYIKKYLPIETYKRVKTDAYLAPLTPRKKEQIVIEEDEVEQAKLTIGCVVDNVQDQMLHYVWNLYTIILGASPDSKFFQNIREKHSVAYYISAGMRKLDHLMIIRAGIDESNFKKTVSLIKKEMKAMEKGEFTEEDINKAKMIYSTALDEMSDNANTLLESFVTSDLTGIDSIEKRKDKIQKVTKEEIVAFAKKVHIDTIYLLKGGSHEEN